MALWPPSAWSWWDAPDIWEYASALAGAGFGAWAALADHDQKTLPAILTAAAAASTLTAKIVSKRVEGVRKAKEKRDLRSVTAAAVRAILDQMRAEYFADETEEEKYKHRVTLFTCMGQADCADKGKHLAIYARSGVHLTSTRTWLLNDDHPEGCRGVAGKVWYHNVTSIKMATCDWPANGDPLLKAQYAASLDITVPEAEALNVKSRAFAAAPVLVGGRKWGVLLLDSLKNGFIADTPHKKGLLNRYTELIGRVLTEAGA